MTILKMIINQFNAIFLATLLISLSTLISCNSNEQLKEQVTVEAKTEVIPNATLALEVEGMVCSKGCVKAIQSALAKQDGVASCVVDYETKLATIEYDNQLVSADDLVGVFPSIGNGSYIASRSNVPETY